MPAHHRGVTHLSLSSAAVLLSALLSFGACRASAPCETPSAPLREPAATDAGKIAPQPAHDAGATSNQEPACDPGDREVCVCPDGSTGSRRCDGPSFSPCDACPAGVRCGTTECEMQRIELLSLSLPACCPKGREDRCGIDVGYVAKNWGYAATCLELNAPGKLDPSCPELSVPLPDGRLAELKGCRTPAGRCGYDVRVAGGAELGCSEPPARLGR